MAGRGSFAGSPMGDGQFLQQTQYHSQTHAPPPPQQTTSTRGRKRKNQGGRAGDAYGQKQQQQQHGAAASSHFPQQPPHQQGNPYPRPPNTMLPPQPMSTGMGFGLSVDDEPTDFVMDDLDRLTSRDVAMARYKRHHDLLGRIFDARRIGECQREISLFLARVYAIKLSSSHS